MQLDDELKQELIKRIEEGKDIPESFKSLLFPPKEEPKEIEERVNKIVKNATRTKLFYRLNNLRAEGLIKGKFIGPGKGVWIWWKKGIFEK